MNLKLILLLGLSFSGAMAANRLTLDQYIGLVNQLRLELHKSSANSNEIKILVAQIFTSEDRGPNPAFLPAICAVKASFVDNYRSDPGHLATADRAWFEAECAKYLMPGDGVMRIWERTTPDKIRERLLREDLIPWLEKKPEGFLEVIQILQRFYHDDTVIKRELDLRSV